MLACSRVLASHYWQLSEEWGEAILKRAAWQEARAYGGSTDDCDRAATSCPSAFHNAGTAACLTVVLICSRDVTRQRRFQTMLEQIRMDRQSSSFSETYA